MVEVTLDGRDDDAEVVIVRLPVIDGTLLWRFTEGAIHRILLDDDGRTVNHDTVSWEEASEDLWFT